MAQLVFFDLDGTVSRRDTLWQYVQAFLWRHPWRWPRLLTVLPTLLRFWRGRADHGDLKASLLRAALGGTTRAAIERHTASWVPRCAARACYADALAAIRAHRSQGDTLVLMSASVDLYVPQLAKALGFSEAICTLTTWRDNGGYGGDLASTNCRGEEKVRQFRARQQAHGAGMCWAYGNSDEDLPHLRLADRAFMINGSKALRAKATALGVLCIDWR